MFRFIAFGYLIFVFTTSVTNAISCGYTTNSLSGTISSPLKRGEIIPYGFQCVWTITAPAGYKISLESQAFELPGKSQKCTPDWVAFESLLGNGNVLPHGKFCGSSLPPKILSKENQLRIRFVYYGDMFRREISYFIFNYTAAFRESTHFLIGEWIKNNTQKFIDDKENLPRTIPAIFLFNETYFHQNNTTTENLTTQYRLKLAADLIRNSTHPMTAFALSQHVTALLTICINPRSVYGIDLVGRLRSLVNGKKELVNPYYFLSLCNAGDEMTSSDVRMLKSIIGRQKQDIFWLDFRAMALMGLVCARDQKKSHDVDKEIIQASSSFKSHQRQDGSFGSLKTTSLIIQALRAAEADDFGWNKTSAIEFVQKLNHSDGSFGNIYKLFAAIPVTSNKTVLDINLSNCDFRPEDLTPFEEENLGKPINVTYSLWIGDNIDFSYTVTVKVPNGTKFLDFMRIAAEKDKKFEFEWTYERNVPYVYQIYEFVSDPASGKYWILLTGTNTMDLGPYQERLDDYLPRDGDIAVMWYKTVTTDYPWKEIGHK